MIPYSAQQAQSRQANMMSPYSYKPKIMGAHYQGAYGGKSGSIDPFSGPSLKQRTTPNNLGRGYGSTSQPQISLVDGSQAPSFASINLPPMMGSDQQSDPFQTNPFLKKKPFSPFAMSAGNAAVQPGPPDPVTMGFQNLL